MLNPLFRAGICFVLALSSILGTETEPACEGHTARYCCTCARDSRGRIKRNTSVRRAFQRTHPCPATGRATGACPGYVVDHIRPLKEGGADAVENMQWQRTDQAKAKDRVE
jgi:hypothetical protein